MNRDKIFVYHRKRMPGLSVPMADERELRVTAFLRRDCGCARAITLRRHKRARVSCSEVKHVWVLYMCTTVAHIVDVWRYRDGPTIRLTRSFSLSLCALRLPLLRFVGYRRSLSFIAIAPSSSPRVHTVSLPPALPFGYPAGEAGSHSPHQSLIFQHDMHCRPSRVGFAALPSRPFTRPLTKEKSTRSANRRTKSLW